MKEYLPVALVENNITETHKYKISHSLLYFSSDLWWQSCPTRLSCHLVNRILISLPRLNLSLDAMTFTVFSILYWRCWAWASAVNTRKLSPLCYFPSPGPSSACDRCINRRPASLLCLPSAVCGSACLLWYWLDYTSLTSMESSSLQNILLRESKQPHGCFSLRWTQDITA